MKQLRNVTLGLGSGAGMAGEVMIGGGVGAAGALAGLGLVPTRKMWIGAALGAAVGLGTSLLGGMQASKAAKAAERRQRDAEAKEDAWYNRAYNQDYVDTAAGQNLVNRAKEYAREQWRKAAGAQAVAGGTEAATAAAKEAGNKMVGDTIANIAATDEARKMQADRLHRQADAQFTQQDMAREQQRAQNITTAAGNASNAIMSAAMAAEQAGTSKTDLTGGSNNSSQWRGVEGSPHAYTDGN